LAVLLRDETAWIRSSSDIVKVRQLVRDWAISMGFSLVEQTKIVTAASELGRNALDYGGGGEVRLEMIQNELRRGLKVTFIDQGPGIPDLEQALKDGFSTGTGMGLGLSGAKRLVSEFEIDSAAGRGTKVSITRWRNT